MHRSPVHNNSSDNRKTQNKDVTDILAEMLYALSTPQRQIIAGIPKDPNDLVQALATFVVRLFFVLSAAQNSPSTPFADQLRILSEQLNTALTERGSSTLSNQYYTWNNLLRYIQAAKNMWVGDPTQSQTLLSIPLPSFLESEAVSPYRCPFTDLTVARLFHVLQPLQHNAALMIGAVYEQLLGLAGTAINTPTMQLKCTSKNNRNAIITLNELKETSPHALIQQLAERTGRSANAIHRDLESSGDSQDRAALIQRCHSQANVTAFLPFAKLVDRDTWGNPMVFETDSIQLTRSTRRRASGSHYTPNFLTNPTVAATLRPTLAAMGPAPSENQLLALRICDPAMGAGAFLIETCAQLTQQLISIWKSQQSKPEDCQALAAQKVAKHCLYGVDKNPMAVHVAQAALWLFTRATHHPLTFLQDNLKQGDALIGLQANQIANGHWDQRQSFSLNTPTKTLGNVSTDHGDQLIATFFSASTPTQREAARQRLHHSTHGSTTPTDRLPFKPIHWDLEFPAVFNRANPGFDCVVGNPPFANAIASITARTKSEKEYFRLQFPYFAQGTYDQCVLFLGRALNTLVRKEGGTVGFVLPAVLLSQDQAWQQKMHQHCRPIQIALHPPNVFGASVRTVTIVAQSGKAANVLVQHPDHPDTTRDWVNHPLPWFQVFSQGSTTQNQLDSVALSEVCHIHAGCSASVGYALREETTDQEHGSGIKLITTGSIDRYQCDWGNKTTRFLKAKFNHPRWPTTPQSPHVKRAWSRQRRPKILVAGLTDVIEAIADNDGQLGGGVSTWVIAAKPETKLSVALLTSLLNSASFSRHYMERFGATGLAGGQVTIKKSGLLSTPIPKSLLGAAPERLKETFNQAVSIPVLLHALEVISTAMTNQIHPAHVRQLDKLSHAIWSTLYGQDPEADYLWWCSRSRSEPLTTTPAQLWKSLDKIIT